MESDMLINSNHTIDQLQKFIALGIAQRLIIIRADLFNDASDFIIQKQNDLLSLLTSADPLHLSNDNMIRLKPPIVKVLQILVPPTGPIINFTSSLGFQLGFSN